MNLVSSRLLYEPVIARLKGFFEEGDKAVGAWPNSRGGFDS